MSTIALETVGRRIYLLGNTYPVKGAIRDAGGKWDSERRAWWMGSGKRAAAEAIAAEAPAVVEQAGNVARWIPVPGGGWAMRIPGVVEAGATVTVAKRDGSTQQQTVLHVVERREEDGQKYTIALAPERQRAAGHGARGRRTGCACGSIEGRTRDSDCWTCRHDA